MIEISKHLAAAALVAAACLYAQDSPPIVQVIPEHPGAGDSISLSIVLHTIQWDGTGCFPGYEYQTGRRISGDTIFLQYLERQTSGGCEGLLPPPGSYSFGPTYGLGVLPEGNYLLILNDSLGIGELGIAGNTAYIPFPTDSACWVEIHQSSPGYNPIPCGTSYRDTTLHYLNGKVVVDGKTFGRLYEKSRRVNNGLIGYLREDSSKKVFYRDPGCDSCAEVLLYDFGLRIGSKVVVGSTPYSWLAGGPGRSAELTLLRIDTLVVFGKARRTFDLGVTTWIEGVGEMAGLLHQDYWCCWDDFCNIHTWWVDEFSTGKFTDVESRADGRKVSAPLMVAAPNPFNLSTAVTFLCCDFTDPVACLGIFDMSGRLVRMLSSPALAGRAEFAWDGRSGAGGRLPSGVYAGRVMAGGKKAEIKLFLAK